MINTAPTGPRGDSSFEMEPGERIPYNQLHGLQILSASPSGWVEISLEGGYKCALKLEKPDTIAKLTIWKDRTPILDYDRGDYDTTTDEGEEVERRIREIFPDFA